jgi:hypothetical protein
MAIRGRLSEQILQLIVRDPQQPGVHGYVVSFSIDVTMGMLD